MTDPVDELFAGEMSEFVAKRDALVRQLKQDGDKDGAASVKQLRKPSAVAWAVNQVARRQPDAIDALVAAARAVHAAQARAVQGKDGAGLRETTAAWRAQVRALADHVARDAGEQHRDEAAATFEAASTSEELGVVLKAGRLTAALSPSGFGLQGMPEPAAPREKPLAPMEPAPEPESVEDPADTAAIEEARARVEKADAAVEKATHRLRRAEQRLEVAEQAVREATAARDDAIAARAALEASD